MILQRMNDRENRTNREFFRKRVFLEEVNNTKTIIIQFHSDYNKIFQNYITAYTVIPSALVGRLLSYDNESLIITTEYMGKPILNAGNDIESARNSLSKINSLSISSGFYEAPRYVSDLLKRSDGTHKALAKLYDSLCSRPITTLLGIGVEDPALSNFVTNGQEAYLIDLDNYGESYSLDSMLGFLIADAAMEGRSELSVEYLVNYASESRRPINVGLLLCGAIGRVAVTIIDKDIVHSSVETVVWAAALIERMAARAYIELYQ